MDVREGEDVEFKREMSPGAVKTVIAFVSTGGGTLCIGVDDEGVPVGVDDVDAEMTRVTSCLRDSVKSDILMMISIVSEMIDGHDVIAVHVGRGVRRPYYLASRGPRPEGVLSHGEGRCACCCTGSHGGWRRRSRLEFGFEVGARMIDAFGLRRIIVAGGFGVIGSSFVHHMVREDPARR